MGGKRFIQLLFTGTVVAYPLLVLLIFHFPGWAVAFASALIVLGLLRTALVLISGTRTNPSLPAWVSHCTNLSMIGIGVFFLLTDNMFSFQIYPIIISTAFLLVFSLSLNTERSMIERFASVYEKNITPRKKRYMQKVTLLWCGFFTVNIGISTFTWLAMSPGAWAWYNGVISYLLMAGLFALEYCYRRLFVINKKTS